MVELISRRAFHAGIAVTLTGSLLAPLEAAKADITPCVDTAAAAGFGYRIRYFRNNHSLRLWTRVIRSRVQPRLIRFHIEISSDRPAINILETRQAEALRDLSYIGRHSFVLPSVIADARAPLYCRLRLGSGLAPSRIMRIGKA